MSALVLFYVFFRIGLFAVGGGYAMIPLIRAELLARAWLPEADFLDILAVAEMTPGPIAVNAATFVGYRVAGGGGAILATLGVCLPGFLASLLMAGLAWRLKEHPAWRSALTLVKAVVAGLLLFAALRLSQSVFWPAAAGSPGWGGGAAALLAVGVFWLSGRRVHPLALILGAATGGLLIRGWLWPV